MKGPKVGMACADNLDKSTTYWEITTMSFSREEAMGEQKSGFEDVLQRLLDWVKSRTADHWLMFAIGLIIGLIL